MSKIYNLTSDDGKEITLVVGEDDVTVRVETIGEITVNYLDFFGVFPEINNINQYEIYEPIETKDGIILAPKD